MQYICCYVLVFNLLTYKTQKMKVKCKNDNVTIIRYNLPAQSSIDITLYILPNVK